MELNKLSTAVLTLDYKVYFPMIRLENKTIFELNRGYDSNDAAHEAADIMIKAFKEGYMRGTYTIND